MDLWAWLPTMMVYQVYRTNCIITPLCLSVRMFVRLIKDTKMSSLKRAVYELYLLCTSQKSKCLTNESKLQEATDFTCFGFLPFTSFQILE